MLFKSVKVSTVDVAFDQNDLVKISYRKIETVIFVCDLEYVELPSRKDE